MTIGAAAALRYSMAMVVVFMPWVLMSAGVAAEMFVADGVFAPVHMSSFPVMKPPQPERFTDQPDMVGAQIIILRSDDTHIFVPVPDVKIRNPYLHRN